MNGLLAKLEDIIRRNLAENYRRLVILEDGAFERYIGEIIKLYDRIRGERYSILITGKENREDAKWIRYILDPLTDKIKDNKIQWGYVPFKECERIMGTTWDILIADLRKDLRPNDIGRIVEVARGGGLIIFIAPNRDDWKRRIVPFHKDMVSSPYTLNDVRPIFLRYFVESLEESPGVYFIDLDGNIYGSEYESTSISRRSIEIPSDISFDKTIYRIALTQDQVEALYAIDKASRSGGSVVITADRGRGKSAVLGLAIAGIMHRDVKSERDRMKIDVTAPEPLNVKEVFNFIARVFHMLKVKFTVKRREGRIVELHSVLGQVRYVEPFNVLKDRADLVVVDEAAGTPVNILLGIADRFESAIFSSTLHGYEGAGRGFQMRFLPALRRMKGRKLFEVHMEEPIRYNPGDPIERWLFKALFLDSDPAEFDEDEASKISLNKLRYVKVDLEEWVFKKRDKLREYIGIYIYAHYRNRPNDIMILCDAPHHFARALMYEDHVVNSLHLCFEGRMTEEDVKKTLAGAPPSGHLIPTVIIRYYPSFVRFSKLRGIRIVRIATHPQLMNLGIGSKALEYVYKEAKDLGLDWIGASFGATEQLLNFWIKNDFYPVYLSPVKNPISGEFSTIVIKPISKEAKEMIRRIRVEFKKMFVEGLVDPHFVLDYKLAYQLLSSDPWSIKYNPVLTDNQHARLKEFIFGGLHYGAAYDAIRELVKAHFIRSPDNRVPIPKKYEYIILTKVLQARSWEKICNEFNIERDDLINKFKEYIGKMRLEYL